MKSFLSALLGLAAALLAVAWFFARPEMKGVEVTAPTRGPAVQAVYATGTVEATVMMPIAARAAARLVALESDEGAEVTKGQALARLENNDLQKAQAALEAKADFAKKDYDRKAELARRGYETKAALDAAKSAWESASAAAAQATIEAGYMTLAAPADGRIIKRDGEVGEMIAANQPIFWMSCCAPLRVSAEVDEEDISAVKPGQEVLVRADAFPGQVFKGKVQSITPKGDPVARSFRVRASLEDTPLQIGMTAETNIIIGQRDDALLLPTAALSKDNEVWVVKGGRLEARTVTVGARGPDLSEITSGLDESDMVVLKPGQDMKAGQKVRSVVRK